MKKILSKSALGIVLMLASGIVVTSLIGETSNTSEYLTQNIEQTSRNGERETTYDYSTDNFIGTTAGADEQIENDYDTLTENAIIERSPILVGEGKNFGFNEYYDIPLLGTTGGTIDLRVNSNSEKIEFRINTFPESMIEYQALSENVDHQWKIQIHTIAPSNSEGIGSTSLTHTVAYWIGDWEPVGNQEWVEIEIQGDYSDEILKESSMMYIDILDYTRYLEHTENNEIPANTNGAGIWTSDWRIKPLRLSLVNNYYKMENTLRNTMVSQNSVDSDSTVFSFYNENSDGTYEQIYDKSQEANSGRFNVKAESYVEEYNSHTSLFLNADLKEDPVLEYYSFYEGNGNFNFHFKKKSTFTIPEGINWDGISIKYGHIENPDEKPSSVLGGYTKFTDEQEAAIAENKIIFSEVNVLENLLDNFLNKNYKFNYTIAANLPAPTTEDPEATIRKYASNSTYGISPSNTDVIGISDVIEYNLPYVDDLGIEWTEESDSNFVDFDWEISEDNAKVINVDAVLNNDATLWFTTDNKETEEEVEFKVVDDSNWTSEATTIRDGEEATKYSYEISSGKLTSDFGRKFDIIDSSDFVFESNGYTFNMDIHYDQTVTFDSDINYDDSFIGTDADGVGHSVSSQHNIYVDEENNYYDGLVVDDSEGFESYVINEEEIIRANPFLESVVQTDNEITLTYKDGTTETAIVYFASDSELPEDYSLTSEYYEIVKYAYENNYITSKNDLDAKTLETMRDLYLTSTPTSSIVEQFSKELDGEYYIGDLSSLALEDARTKTDLSIEEFATSDEWDETYKIYSTTSPSETEYLLEDSVVDVEMKHKKDSDLIYSGDAEFTYELNAIEDPYFIEIKDSLTEEFKDITIDRKEIYDNGFDKYTEQIYASFNEANLGENRGNTFEIESIEWTYDQVKSTANLVVSKNGVLTQEISLEFGNGDVAEVTIPDEDDFTGLFAYRNAVQERQNEVIETFNIENSQQNAGSALFTFSYFGISEDGEHVAANLGDDSVKIVLENNATSEVLEPFNATQQPGGLWKIDGLSSQTGYSVRDLIIDGEHFAVNKTSIITSYYQSSIVSDSKIKISNATDTSFNLSIELNGDGAFGAIEDFSNKSLDEGTIVRYGDKEFEANLVTDTKAELNDEVVKGQQYFTFNVKTDEMITDWTKVNIRLGTIQPTDSENDNVVIFNGEEYNKDEYISFEELPVEVVEPTEDGNNKLLYIIIAVVAVLLILLILLVILLKLKKSKDEE